jgi:hypothetical protein
MHRPRTRILRRVRTFTADNLVQRRHMFVLVASASLAGANVLLANPTEKQSSSHVDWVAKVLTACSRSNRA